jgi:hypothetical protein
VFLHRLADLLRESGRLVDAFANKATRAVRGREAREHPELARIVTRFERINAVLKKGAEAGYLTPAQLRSLAGNLTAIAAALLKAAVQYGLSRAGARPKVGTTS